MTEVMNSMDYKIQMRHNTKVFHANLLKEYIKRKDDTEEQEGGMAIIDEELHEDIGVVNNDEIIELCEKGGNESCRDVSLDEALENEKKTQLEGIVSKYRSLFTDLPGTSNLAEHVIETTIKEPVRAKPYPTPYAVRETVEEQLKRK